MATITRTIGAFHDASNSRIRKIGQYTGPASYVTGGDALAPSDLGVSHIELLLFEPAVNATPKTFTLVYDTANKKILWMDPTTGLEVANATVLSGYSARFEAIGL